MMLRVFVVLLGVVCAYKYPNCPGGIPIDIGNTTDAHYQKLLTLTDFIDYHKDENLLPAFQTYARTGQSSAVSSIVSKNKNFYIAILTILALLSLVLFFIMIKLGKIKIVSREVFEKIKQQGYSTALSAFYSLLALILIVSTGVVVYLLVSMISSLQMTQCRMDVLNQVYLNGSPQTNWQGLNQFSKKIAQVNSITTSINASYGSWGNHTQQLISSDLAIQQLEEIYSGIVNSYSQAVIGDSSITFQSISMKTLLPQLFQQYQQTDPLTLPLNNYLSLLSQTLGAFQQLEVIINNTHNNAETSIPLLQSIQLQLQQTITAYSKDYLHFRTQLDTFFDGTHSFLIICTTMISFTMVGAVVSLVVLKLIQRDYDLFSLKVYKTIWFFLLLLFLLNLIFLLLFNQLVVYNSGMCQFSHEVLTNRTHLETIFPQTTPHRSMYYASSCYFQHDFVDLTKSSTLVGSTVQYLRLKEDILRNKTTMKIGLYQDVINEVVTGIRPFQFGQQGSFAYLENEVTRINGYTNNNYLNQNCFKHQWTMSESKCGAIAAPKPSAIAYFNHSQQYTAQPTQCYVLHNYPLSTTPTTHTHSSFTDLYSPYLIECPYSVHQLTTSTVSFFSTLSHRTLVFQGLIDSLRNLSTPIQTTTSNLLTYHTSKSPWLSSTPQEHILPSYFLQGNNCVIVKSLTNGIYNEYCLNLRANSHKVYLLVICNICYIIFMIIFSLLYAIQIRSLSEKDIEESFHNLQFLQSQSRISSGSQSQLTVDIQNKSTNSKSSGEIGN